MLGLPFGHFVPLGACLLSLCMSGVMVVSNPGVHLTGTLVCVIHLSLGCLMLVLIFDSFLRVKCFLSSNSSLGSEVCLYKVS